jgi:hypothetical protein
MDAIFADMGGEPDKIGGNKVSDEALLHAVATTVTQLLKSGLRLCDVREMLPFAEPFRSNWERTETLIDKMHKTGEENAG